MAYIDEFEEKARAGETTGADAGNDTRIVPQPAGAGKAPDFSLFQGDNWIKEPAADNKTLHAIRERGGAAWITPAGAVMFRRHHEDEPARLELQKAGLVLSNYLDKSDLLLFKGTGTGDNHREPDIGRADLIMAEDRFSPFQLSEFYQEKGHWYRTAFLPTDYLKAKPGKYREPETILALIRHLCNGNPDYFRWVVNWLAGFFQTLEKSQVALVFRGDQGTGKGIFFNDVLTPLFGEPFTVTVDDERLKSAFKNWIGEKLFFNLNEISHDKTSRKTVKNFIKQLVTDQTIQAERKYENATRTEVHGNVLITSNETFALEVEPGDRRFTVIKTGGNLKQEGWDTGETIRKVKEELGDFAVYLKSYPVDWKAYHEALDTPEKAAMVAGTTDRFTHFAHMLKTCNISYFEGELEECPDVKMDIRAELEKGYITQPTATKAFAAIHDEETTTNGLFRKLEAVDPLAFGKKGPNRKKVKGSFRFYLKHPPKMEES